jgi:hypothetical protein
VRRLACLALALALAVAVGCAAGKGSDGTATLWVTRDRGKTVIFEGKVPAGLTAMQALDRELDIDTRYGGRFVQAIEGVHGDASKRRDWFWYVNGIEGDRSAAEYRLRPGDVEWWDYRSWKDQMSVPVVVGAFPEPFLHGYDGDVEPVTVVAHDKRLGRRFRRLLGASERSNETGPIFAIRPGVRIFHAGVRNGRIEFLINPRDARRLAADPTLARFHYQGLG